MADIPFRITDANRGDAFGPDYEASVSPGVPEFYGAKIQLFYSDREFRFAVGNAYGHLTEKGELFVEPRYKVAVFMPVETVRELYLQIGTALNVLDHKPVESGFVAATPAPDIEH